MAEADTTKHSLAGATSGDAAVIHIVHIEEPPAGVDHHSFYLRKLSSLLGSEEAAKEALVYSYSRAASGFSAKLTPKQAEDLQKQDGVLQVQPDSVYRLHGPGSGLNT